MPLLGCCACQRRRSYYAALAEQAERGVALRGVCVCVLWRDGWRGRVCVSAAAERVCVSVWDRVCDAECVSVWQCVCLFGSVWNRDVWT